MATAAKKSTTGTRKPPVPANETDRDKFTRLGLKEIADDEGIIASAYGESVAEAHGQLTDVFNETTKVAFNKDGSLNKKWAEKNGVEGGVEGMIQAAYENAAFASMFAVGDDDEQFSDDDDDECCI